MLTRCIAILVVTLLVTGVGCAVVLAAVDSAPINLDLRDADVRSAIESLFRGTGRNYSISQDVAGTIPSLSITGVPFDQALKSLLKSAGLVYRVENNVYMISKKPETSASATMDTAMVAVDSSAVDTTTTVESIIDKIPLSNTGASEILAIMQGNNNNSSGGMGGGMMGGMGGMGGGMMGGMGGGMMGGMGGGSSYGGGMMGGGGYGGSSGGYGGSSGGYGGSRGGYGGSSGGYGGGGGRSW